MKIRSPFEDDIPEDDRGDTCPNGYVHLFNPTDLEQNVYAKAVCSRPWCHSCEEVRKWKIRSRIAEYTSFHEDVPHWWFVTRSVRNDASLSVAWENLHATNRKFQQIMKRSSAGWDRVAAWIGSYEITWSLKEGYNVHQHLVVGSGDYLLDYSAIQQAWKQAADDPAAHFDAKKLVDQQHAKNYLSKYFAKSSSPLFWGGISEGLAYRNRDVLRGRNRIVTMRKTKPVSHGSVYCLCCSTGKRSGCNRTYGWANPVEAAAPASGRSGGQRTSKE